MNEILHEILRYINFVVGKEEETFNFLVYLSAQFGHLLPLKNETGYSNDIAHSHEMDISRLKNSLIFEHFMDLVRSLTNYYVQQINIILEQNDFVKSDGGLNKNNIYYICTCLEKLQVLVGDKSTYDKFSVLISRHLDTLRQKIITSFQNPLTNLHEINNNFKSLSDRAKCLIDVVLTVSTCSGLMKDQHQKVLMFMQETVLEKLSSELLTLTHSLKESLISLKTKPEGHNAIHDHKRVHSLSDLSNMPIISLEVLTEFAQIVNQYLLLDDYIFNSKTLSIMKSTCNARQNRSVLKQQSPFELPDLIRSSQQSSTINRSITPITNGSKWPWFESLRDLASCISNSLVHHISQISANLLEEGKYKYKLKDGSAFEVMDSISGTISSSEHSPKLVIIWIRQFLKTLVAFVPYGILGGKFKQLIKLQSDYLDVTNQALKDLKPFMMSLIEDFPEFVSANYLPTILATSHDVVAVLEYCAHKMQHDGRMPFHGSIQLYTSLCKRVQQTIVQYHKNKLSTTLLHDGASHHWNDLRPFFEGDKHSFAIKRWRSHLHQLMRDLNSKLWNEISQVTVLEILSASLNVLTNRYTRCTPSHNRNKQVGLDITAILFICYEFLWKIAPNPEDLFSIQPCYSDTNDAVSKIHKNCKDLFQCLNIVSSPLSQLHASYLDVNKHNIVQWQSYVNPSLFPVVWDGTASSLPDHLYVICCLKLLPYRKENAAEAVLHVLRAKNCFLSIKLVSNDLINNLENTMIMQKNLLKVMSSDKSFGKIFIECVKSSSNFTHSMFLDLNFFRNSMPEARLPWQICLYECVMPFIPDCLKTVLEFLSSNSNMSNFSKIPGYVQLDDSEVCLNSTDDIVKICVCLILQHLKTVALTLSESTRIIFIEVDRLLHTVHLQDAMNFRCFGSHVLVSAVYHALSNTSKLEKDFHILMNEDCKDNLNATLKFLKDISLFDYHNSDFELEGFDLRFEIQSFKKCTRQLLSSSIQSQFNLNCEEYFDLLTLDVQTTVASENINGSITSIYQYLLKNIDIIVSKYQITTIPFVDEISSVLKPLDDVVLNHKWDWKKSIPGCIKSLPKEVLVSLLHHRPDMQENAFVNAQEKKLVQEIKSYYSTSL